MGRRIETEVLVVGDGCGALCAAVQLLNQGFQVTLVNPEPDFGIADLRPHDGLALWRAAYRSAEPSITLSSLWEVLQSRLREALPVSMDEVGVERGEHWSLLSHTPIHKQMTATFEQEYFRLERKPWSAGHCRLVNPEHVKIRGQVLGLHLPHVATLEGSIVRNYGLWWDAPQMGRYLTEFVQRKYADGKAGMCLRGAQIDKRVGRRLHVSWQGEDLSLEYTKALLIFLNGEILPSLKTLVAQTKAPWLQGVRKRRHEQHYLWFENEPAESTDVALEPFWLELGHVSYRFWNKGGLATWKTRTRPDGVETVIDEGLRVQSGSRLKNLKRHFCLEWEWKEPQWRDTGFQTYWATAYEGDLWALMEILWNLPIQ